MADHPVVELPCGCCKVVVHWKWGERMIPCPTTERNFVVRWVIPQPVIEVREMKQSDGS